MPYVADILARMRGALRPTPLMETLLLLRNARGLAHRVPALKLVRHVLAEGLGGRAAHDHAGRGQALLHGVLLEAFVDDRVELGDDRARRVARREHAVPRRDVVAGKHARFDRGRHVRHRRKAVLAGNRERLELASAPAPAPPKPYR